MPHVSRSGRPVHFTPMPGLPGEDNADGPRTSPETYRRFMDMQLEVRDYLFTYLEAYQDLAMTVDEQALIKMMDTAERRYEEDTGRKSQPYHWTPVDPSHNPVVYYLRFDSMVKIGTTTNIHLRLQQLPHDRLLALEWGDRRVERGRHEQFARLRRTGEWFHAEQALVDHATATRERFEVDVRMNTESWMQRLLAR